eukprot:CCRYP_003823-RC/>CCRYP_003823-RC protein AED:0.47 eAED:0.45 QI:0/-1/0/1/-1/1/1/0/112
MVHKAVYILIILEEMGHHQPPTPIQTDNTMADAVINGKIQPKRTKAMDMPWTCAFTGYTTENVNNNLGSTDGLVKQTMPTIGPSTILLPTKLTLENNFSPHSLSLKCFSNDS